MEAATPLRRTRVHALIGRLIVENLVVDDPVAAELVRAATEAGEDPVRVVADAIEIGARILEREQAGATRRGAARGHGEGLARGRGSAWARPPSRW